MSTVTLQLGQCGNQMGAELFTALGEEAFGAGGERTAAAFFRADAGGQQRARALLLDMEPKVVGASLLAPRAARAAWRYSERATVLQQSGSGEGWKGEMKLCVPLAPSCPLSGREHALSLTLPPLAGNNWALGYHRHGASHAAAAVELARREVERCDAFGGFLLLQSLAGGTGAGFGSRVAEAVRDEFASAFCISAAVWPYEAGEVATQAINCVLSVHALLGACDGVVLLRNEDLAATCQVMDYKCWGWKG